MKLSTSWVNLIFNANAKFNFAFEEMLSKTSTWEGLGIYIHTYIHTYIHPHMYTLPTVVYTMYAYIIVKIRYIWMIDQIWSDLELTCCIPRFSMSICFHCFFFHGRATLCPLKVSATWRCWDWLADRFSCSSSGTKASMASIRPSATCSAWSGRLQRRVWNSEKSGASSSNMEFTGMGNITFERKSEHGPSFAKNASGETNCLEVKWSTISRSDPARFKWPQ